MLISKNNTALWNQNQLLDAKYIVPNTMIIGKNIIRVKSQVFPGAGAGQNKMKIVKS
jgi:hypothetical protein